MMWTPKFKVGDRVVVSFVGETLFEGAGTVERVPTEPGVCYLVRYDGKDVSTSVHEQWMYAEPEAARAGK